MLRASRLFGDEDRKRIREAVSQAEKTTSGEIVPVVATSSGDYDRAEDLVGLWLAGIGLVIYWWLMLPPTEAGAWDAPEASLSLLGLVTALAVVAAGFLGGSLVAANIGWLRRLFASRALMRRCVEEAAGRIFFEQGVRETRARTGIMIYLSLFERVVRITGDHSISEKLTESDWQQVRDLILEGIKQGKAADGLIAGIHRCGELLAEHFPIQPGDADELHNDLRILD